MDTCIKNYVEEKTKELIAAPSCYQGLRDLAEKYLAALEADVLSIDALIAFAGSEKGIQIFGNEQAKTMVSQAQAAKANGAKYCICPACTAGGAILDKKDEILK